MASKKKTSPGPRMVRASQACYIDHILRKAGEVFSYDGDPAPNVFEDVEEAKPAASAKERPAAPVRPAVPSPSPSDSSLLD